MIKLGFLDTTFSSSDPLKWTSCSLPWPVENECQMHLGLQKHGMKG